MKEIEKELVEQLQNLQEEIEYIDNKLLTPKDIGWTHDARERVIRANKANTIPLRIKYRLINEYNCILAEYRI